MHLTHLLTIAFRLRSPYSLLQAIDAESCIGDNILAEGDSAIPDKFFIKLERFLKHVHWWTWYVIFYSSLAYPFKCLKHCMILHLGWFNQFGIMLCKVELGAKLPELSVFIE
jgi:hypothetical protein